MSGAPTAPGDSYSESFGSATPNANAPVISEWNLTAKPNETFTLTGTRFTSRSGALAGSDITVWIWAWNGTSGTLRQCKIWKTYGDYLIMACIPSDVPFGQYLVWVENQDGVSAPVCINKPQAEWIGPLGPYAAAGDTKRVFGKNLSTGHGTATSFVYIQPAAGGSFTPCNVTNVEPCAVAFTIPAGTANGSYKVFVHSGHGGRYGWSKPLDLTVQGNWVRGTGVYNLSPSGGNDATALQNAINTVSAWTNGGTVQLANGSYSCTSTVTMKNNVRLAGADKTLTTVIFSGCNLELSNGGANHLAIENMNIMPASGTSFSMLSRSVSGGSYNNDVLVRNVDFKCNTDAVSSVHTYFMVDRFESDNCTWQGALAGDGRDWYIHNNTLHGGRGDTDGCMALQQGGTTPHGRYVIEYNAASTPAWPNQGGNRNYKEYLTTAQWNQLIWCARLIYFQMGCDSYENSYISHNTTQDVAIDDNKGETILLHSSEAYKYAQVASNSGRTLTIRTDGKIDGNAGFTIDAAAYAPMTSVPNTIVWGVSGIDDRAYVQICYGTGIGQIRRIASHTATTITVDSDWRVPPAADSRIQINYIYRNHIQYQNTFNAMPVGFVNKGHCASYAVNYDGGCFGCVAEGNTSNRTFYGDALQGYTANPSYFNEMRNDANYAPLSTGSGICARTTYQWYAASGSVVGPEVIGCYIRGAIEKKGISSTSISDVLTSNSRHLIGCAIEGTAVTGGTSSGNLDDTLLRNNSFTINGTKVAMQSGSQLNLVGNTYSGTGTKYSGTVSFKDRPTPEYRVAHFTGISGATLSPVVIPIANLGIQNSVWSITGTSNTWITASVVSGGTIAPEAETGQLRVSVNTSGMSQGVYWGTVNLTTTNGVNFYVGVELDLTSGNGPEIDVQGGGVSISDGSASPNLSDGTDFGGSNLGNSVDRTFTIANPGNIGLNLTGTPRVTVSGTNASDFAITTQPASTVNAGGSTTFVVQFTPSGLGIRAARVNIPSEDANENPFDFAVQGTGTILTTTSTKINCGGSAVSAWAADAGYNGGAVISTPDTVDTSTVTNPGPQEVYQTARTGECAYYVTGLIPGGDYNARLHFAELTASAVGDRRFNVKVNGTQVLGNYDIFAEVGADSAMIKEFTTATDSAGQIVIEFSKGTTGTDPIVNGIEITASPIQRPPSAGLVLWLRSDAGITATDGKVSDWVDQSGANFTVSQTNPFYRPGYVENAVNGRPVVRFAGSNIVLSSTSGVLTGNTAFTAFAAFREDTLSANYNYQFIWWLGLDNSNAGYGQWLSLASKIRCGWGNWSAYLSPTDAVTADTWYRVASKFSGGSTGTQDLWVNGAWIARNTKPGSNLGSGFAVGNYASSASYQGFIGDIAEILIYSRSLSDTDIVAVDTYLASHWTPAPPITITRLSDIPALSDGTVVSITEAKTAVVPSGTFTDGCIYIEDPDRSSAVKVKGVTAALWDSLLLTGTVMSDVTGEKYLQVKTVNSRAQGSEILALGMTNKTMSATGRLVRVWGRVSDKSFVQFTLDDGSGAPVLVKLTDVNRQLADAVHDGSYVAVTGVATASSGGGVALRPRNDADITVILEF